MQLYEIFLKVKITLLSTEIGGRNSYVSSNYRPVFMFDEINMKCDGSITLENENGKLYPSETAKGVMLRLVSAIPFGEKRPTYFSQFLMKEGTRIIGHGVVTKVIRMKEPELKVVIV